MAEQQKKIISDELFNEQIVSILDLEALPEKDKAVLLDKMISLVNTRLLERLFTTLDQDAQNVLTELLNGESSDKDLETFVVANCPEFVDWVPEEVIKLKSELIDNLQA